MSLGKSSISMGHGFHGYVSHNQRVILVTMFGVQMMVQILRNMAQRWPQFIGYLIIGYLNMIGKHV